MGRKFSFALMCTLLVAVGAFFSKPSMVLSGRKLMSARHSNRLFQSSDSEAPVMFDDQEVTSDEIVRLRKKINDINKMITDVREQKKAEEEELKKLDAEFGGEIARIKKEFARIKERSIEESVEIANKARADALKEVLPITDNFARAKAVFNPIEADGEKKVLQTYEDIFAEFQKVLEDFGVTRVVSVGQPFDFNFMEAIMTSPSTEYAADIVCTEYQVGYKMGDKCIRPAMVVVSTGPGPQ
jgi:molecular chaperone GrpE